MSISLWTGIIYDHDITQHMDWVILHAFLKSNTFISNTKLKLAKKQAKAKQNHFGLTFSIWKLFNFFVHAIIQK